MNKKRLWSIVVLIVALNVAGCLLWIFLSQNANAKIAFKDNLPEMFTVNQTVDVQRYISNSSNKPLVVKAEYEKDGVTSEYFVTDMCFTPNCAGEVKMTVAVEGKKESITTKMKVVDNAPAISMVMEPTFLVGETIEFKDIYDCIKYESQSEVTMKVEKIEYLGGLIRIDEETTFTLDKAGSYEFFVKVSNSGGSAITTVHVVAEMELTDKEKDDLTNNIKKTGSSVAMIALSEEHAQNSDWAWKLAASPSATMSSSGATGSRGRIEFGRNMVPEREYLTMDVKLSKDSGELLVRYLDSEGRTLKDSYYAKPKGEWFQITSEKTYGDEEIAGLLLIIMHPKEGTVDKYDANNVYALVDNCIIHAREGYVPTKNKVVPSNGKDGSAELAVYAGSSVRASYLQIEGKYTDQCFEFTTTMTEKGIYVGTRLDKVTTNMQESNGLFAHIRSNRTDFYAPKMSSTEHKSVLRHPQYLQIGKDYTFTIWVIEGSKKGTNNIVVQIKDGDTIVALFDHESSKDFRNGGDITTNVAKSGCFAVWSVDLNRKITYRMPYHAEIPESVHKVVASTETTGGVAEISPAVIGTNKQAAYLKMEGAYKNEGFTFKTKFTQKGIYVGARMKQVTENMTECPGILLHIRENRLDYYAPTFESNNHKGVLRYKDNTMSNLTRDKEYTFTVWVADGTKPGTNNLVVQIKDGDKILGVLSSEECLDVRNGGDITLGVPTSGSFAVWSVEPTCTIAYEMPVVSEVPKTVNKVVAATETEGGNVTLQTAVPGARKTASYLKMEGNYTNEGFTFTTKWTGTDLHIGARLDDVTQNLTASNGIIILVRHDRIFYYSTKFDDTMMKGIMKFADYGMEALEPDKEYTFTVWVAEGSTPGMNNLIIRIQKDTTILGVFEHESCPDVRNGGDITTNVPTSGAFAVWNEDVSRDISYEIPMVSEIPKIPKNVNKVVESTETTGGTAELESAAEGTSSNASYLQMKGDYAQEGFTFTTTWTGKSDNKEWLYVGARLDTVTQDIRESSGILVEIRNDRVVYYSPKYEAASQRGTIKFSDHSVPTLTIGKSYTFTLWVTNGSQPNTNNFILQIVDDSTGIISVIDHEGCINKKNDGDITTGVAEKGSFAVWNVSKERTINYQMPQTIAVPKPGVTTTDVTTTLKPTTDNNMGQTGFVKVADANYGKQAFEFTTSVSTGQSLFVGARLQKDRITSDVTEARGIVLDIRYDRIQYHSPRLKSDNSYLMGRVNLAKTLTAGKEYTFTVWVIDGSTTGTYNVIVQIKDGDTVHSVVNFDTQKRTGDSTISVEALKSYDQGAFAVWSLVERPITYRVLYGTTAPTK